MGGLISYSGISTKIRAMERWRISDAQFSQMRRFLKGWRRRICIGE